VTHPTLLYLASGNPGKLREFNEAVPRSGVRIEQVPRIDRLPPCIEDGATFEENACKKAVHYSRCVSGLVFADDSGLCVDALGGAPGVYSARFAEVGRAIPISCARTAAGSVSEGTGDISGDASIAEAAAFGSVTANRADDANNTRLIRELKGVLSEQRAAHYFCVIALARAGQVLLTTEGRADGQILESPRGSGGFGYDPYFFYPPLVKTFAELTPEDKFAVSHRGKAFRQLLEVLSSDAVCWTCE
jgi:XTP/dITP diphosphohydrolase